MVVEFVHASAVVIANITYPSVFSDLIMELLSGGELFDSLSNQKNYHFTERRAAEMVKCILSALYYVHTKSIVHRDLKLENIMLSSKTADKTLKLIDFGLSLKFRGGVLHERLGTVGVK